MTPPITNPEPSKPLSILEQLEESQQRATQRLVITEEGAADDGCPVCDGMLMSVNVHGKKQFVCASCMADELEDLHNSLPILMEVVKTELEMRRIGRLPSSRTPDIENMRKYDDACKRHLDALSKLTQPVDDTPKKDGA